MDEIELRFLEIDPEELHNRLIAKGATKVSDELFEEWLFARPEWKEFRGRVRVRKQHKKIEVAYKETRQETSKGNVEIEFSVSDDKAALAFLEKLGLQDPRQQQKRRIHYVIDNVSVDIDFWPHIPPLVEIEASNYEEIKTTAETLGFDMKDSCELDALQVYQEVYGIDLSEVRQLVF